MTYEEFQALNEQITQQESQTYLVGFTDRPIFNEVKAVTAEHAAHRFIERTIVYTNFTGESVQVQVKHDNHSEVFMFQFPRLEPEMFFPEMVRS